MVFDSKLIKQKGHTFTRVGIDEDCKEKKRWLTELQNQIKNRNKFSIPCTLLITSISNAFKGNSKTLSLDAVRDFIRVYNSASICALFCLLSKFQSIFWKSWANSKREGRMSCSVVAGLRFPSPSMLLEMKSSQAMDGATSNCCKQKD